MKLPRLSPRAKTPAFYRYPSIGWEGSLFATGASECEASEKERERDLQPPQAAPQHEKNSARLFQLERGTA